MLNLRFTKNRIHLIDEKVVVKLFEHFYNKVYKGSIKIDLDINNQRQLIKNFVNAVMKQYTYDTVGVNFLIDLFAFGFNYYTGKLLKRKISLNWIVNKRLLKRWKERKSGTDYYTTNFLKEYNINVDELRSSLVEEQQTDYLSIDEVEELTKGRVADSDARLFSCLSSTTLFNHRSPICLLCHQRAACKRLLKSTNLIVFNRRGYGEQV